jgi:hypothetical protein
MRGATGEALPACVPTTQPRAAGQARTTQRHCATAASALPGETAVRAGPQTAPSQPTASTHLDPYAGESKASASFPPPGCAARTFHPIRTDPSNQRFFSSQAVHDSPKQLQSTHVPRNFWNASPRGHVLHRPGGVEHRCPHQFRGRCKGTLRRRITLRDTFPRASISL